MKKFWSDASNTPLYQDWWVGPWAALLSAGGVYDPSPLNAFLKKEFTALNFTSDPFGRALGIGLLDALQGTYLSMNETSVSESLASMISTIFTSFAYPGFFPPSKAFGSEWFDGASVNTLDVLSIINHCRKEAGFESDSDIVIDVIIAQGSNLERVNAADYKTLGMLYRYIEVFSFYGAMNGLERARFTHPDVQYRYVISPATPLPSNYYPLSLNST